MVAIGIATLGVLFVALGAGQTVPKFILGTVAGFKSESVEIQVKPEQGDAVSVKLRGDTQVRRVAPGQTDLSKAEPIKITDVVSGDRVLVNLRPDVFEARRIVVMSSLDIARRNEADRLDWTRRGVMGIVTSKKPSEITLKMRSLQGEERTATVSVAENTRYRRYAPDSVKFAEAKTSGLREIGVGDQLRARGEKSEDGLKVTAEEVVFGTFVTKTGPITAVNVQDKEITVKDLSTGKPLVVKVSPDSQLKKMPDLSAMRAGGPPGGGMRGHGGGAPDLAQMLERMLPPASFEDLKPGETVVVSSTKGASAGQITAIMLVANADMLIQMVAMHSGGSGRPAAGAGGQAMGMGGMGGMMGAMGGGLDLGGMIP